MIHFDHKKLVARKICEVARMRTFLLSATKGTMDEIVIDHEADDSCCKKESWVETWLAIYEAVNPPVQTVAINLPPGV